MTPQDAAPFRAEPSSSAEPELGYSVETTGYSEAYVSEAVYESTEAPSHYQAEEGTCDEYENDLGITAIALYDYQAVGVDEISFDPDDIITNLEMIDDGGWRGLLQGAGTGSTPPATWSCGSRPLAPRPPGLAPPGCGGACTLLLFCLILLLMLLEMCTPQNLLIHCNHVP